MYDCIVVGDGIFANLFIFYFQKAHPCKKILQVFEEDFAPSTSLVSTSVLARRNVQKGVSPLGDLLVESFEEFEFFYKRNNLKGIEECIHSSVCSIESEKVPSFIKRFPQSSKGEYFYNFDEKAYLFYPHVFLENLRENNKTTYLTREKAFVESVEKGVVAVEGESFMASNIVLGVGHYLKKFHFMLPETSIKLKEIRGSYLCFPHEDKKSYSKTVDGINIIYKNLERKLYIGNTQFEGEVSVRDYLELRDKLLSLKLPAIKNARYVSGVRDKGPKRLPFWGELTPGVFSAHGFYKNGFSLSFLAARELVKMLFDK